MERDKGVLDGYHLGEALGPVAKQLGERCGAAAVRLLASRLGEAIGTAEDDRYSYMWRPAVEEHEQNIRTHDYRAALLEALRDAALGATSSRSETALETTQVLLEAPYPTVVRAGIYACSENYGAVGDQFWKYLKEPWFLQPVFWHEVYWLLKKNFLRFSASERSTFLTLVRELRGDWRVEVNRDEWDERHRRDVLHPVAALGDAEVDGLYTELVRRWGPVGDHPDFHSYHTTSWVGERSPVTADALIAMSDHELVQLLREFVPQPRAWEGPTYQGVASAIGDAVRASEDGFAKKLALFAELGRPYQHGVISGLRQRWVDDKKPIDWEAALGLIEHIVSAPVFRSDVQREGEGGWELSVESVISDIADLLKGAASTDRVVSNQLHERSLRALKQVLDLTEPTPAADVKDPVSHAINVPRGRSLEAVINIALAMRRQAEEDAELRAPVWRLLQPIFEPELESGSVGLNAEFSALVGMYCANLHFLNPDWVEGNFDRLFPRTNDSAWRCAAEGFAYQRYMYPWLFRCLVDGGHLRRMIFDETLSDNVSEKALQFLGLAYLEDEEKLGPDGLLSELVHSLNVEKLSQLCWFFWTLRGTSDESGPVRAGRILEFWKAVSATAGDRGGEYPELQSDLSQLAAFITHLDEEMTKVWKSAAKHANVKFHGHVLLENLARLAGQYPVQVFDVFGAALTGFLPDFDEKDVLQCVMSIADAGHIEEAEQICNEYADRGSSLLKATYEKIRAMGSGAGSKTGP